MNYKDLKDRIRKHEGSSGHPYLDTLGNWTVGVGHNIHRAEIPAWCKTVGDVLNGVSDPNQHLIWFADDIVSAEKDARNWLGETFDKLSDIQQQVVTEMAFQLGWHGLSGFKHMRAALVALNVGLAADEGLRSVWATQCPERAHELMALLRG